MKHAALISVLINGHFAYRLISEHRRFVVLESNLKFITSILHIVSVASNQINWTFLDLQMMWTTVL